MKCCEEYGALLDLYVDGEEAAAKNFAGQRELFSVRCV